jgi:eukaryotic-like serine/threonine-protein kinase
MNPERLQLIDQLFQNALDIHPELRAAFLDTACGDDVELRSEVESLLAAHQDAGEFIEGSASDVAAAWSKRSALTPGRLLGHYRIEDFIGAGGAGEVYLAHDTKLGRKVAIKIIPQAEDKEKIARLVREARSASALNQPNILTIYEIGQHEDLTFIVSEYIDGVNLRDHLVKAPLSSREVLDIAVQVASALTAAHEAGIVHRDIKPENIRRRRDGLVKVLDFGLAKLTRKSGLSATDTEADTIGRSLTEPGMVMGTINYMSPEQARGLALDARTDIWSLGVVLYEMCAGQRPFAGTTVADSIAAILTSEPKPLSELAPNLPAEIQEITSKTLRKDPGKRYQTANELFNDLKGLQRRLEFESEIEATKSITPSGRAAEAPAGAGGLNLQKEPELQAASFTAKNADGDTLPEGDTLNSDPRSSAEYLTAEIKKHKLAAIATLLFLTVSITALYYLTRANIATKQTASETFDSIAVLPFANAAQDPNADYLSDGIAQSLIDRLSQLSGLRVMSTSAVFRYKGKMQDAQKVGSDLNVRAVLTGGVKEIGDRLVINVSLDDAKDNRHIWGEQYVRKFADVLAVQGEIAQEVSTNLRGRLTSADERRLAKRYTDNVEAYQLYLKGLYVWKKHTQEDLQKGIEYYKQALEKDSNYALAYCGLSACYGVLGNNYLPPHEAFPIAKAYAAKAIAIDDTLAEAHGAMGAVRLYYDLEFAQAERELKRAQGLNPSSPDAHHLYGDYFEMMGRFDEAKAERKRALELDPLSPLFNSVAGYTLLAARQDDEAIVQLTKAINLEPHYYFGYLWLGQTYEQRKMYERAIETYQKGMTQAQRNSQLIAALGHACAVAGERDKALKALAELREMSRQRYVSPYSFAIIHVGLGDKDQAFAWLQKAFEDRSTSLLWLKVEPLFDPLRDDQHFRDLLLRIGVA